MTNTEAPSRWLHISGLVGVHQPPLTLSDWPELGEVVAVRLVGRDGLVVAIGTDGEHEFALDADVRVAYLEH